jgi:hypothetical protein
LIYVFCAVLSPFLQFSAVFALQHVLSEGYVEGARKYVFDVYMMEWLLTHRRLFNPVQNMSQVNREKPLAILLGEWHVVRRNPARPEKPSLCVSKEVWKAILDSAIGGLRPRAEPPKQHI